MGVGAAGRPHSAARGACHPQPGGLLQGCSLTKKGCRGASPAPVPAPAPTPRGGVWADPSACSVPIAGLVRPEILRQWGRVEPGWPSVLRKPKQFAKTRRPAMPRSTKLGVATVGGGQDLRISYQQLIWQARACLATSPDWLAVVRRCGWRACQMYVRREQQSRSLRLRGVGCCTWPPRLGLGMLSSKRSSQRGRQRGVMRRFATKLASVSGKRKFGQQCSSHLTKRHASRRCISWKSS